SRNSVAATPRSGHETASAFDAGEGRCGVNIVTCNGLAVDCSPRSLTAAARTVDQATVNNGKPRRINVNRGASARQSGAWGVPVIVAIAGRIKAESDLRSQQELRHDPRPSPQQLAFAAGALAAGGARSRLRAGQVRTRQQN